MEGGSSHSTGPVSVIVYTLAVESSVIFLIGKYCINKQQKDKWVNARQVESGALSCVRVFNQMP